LELEVGGRRLNPNFFQRLMVCLKVYPDTNLGCRNIATYVFTESNIEVGASGLASFSIY
jgi:hypothetical protein